MNYLYQLDGIDVTCDGQPDGPDFADFSSGTRIQLDANALVEASGICGPLHPQAQPIDWNHNGVVDPAPVVSYIACAELGIVTDHDDFAAAALGNGLADNGQPLIDSTMCAELP